MNPGTAYVDHLTRTLADRWGIDNWASVLRPRHHARIAATRAMLLEVRNGARVAQGKRPTDARGRFVAVGK